MLQVLSVRCRGFESVSEARDQSRMDKFYLESILRGLLQASSATPAVWENAVSKALFPVMTSASSS